MRFTETALEGVFAVDLELYDDDRGFFARTWCRHEFTEHDLNGDLAQISISMNRTAGTLRGLHMQRKPHEESKLVRCLQGGIFDVAVDMREDSPNYLAWTGRELTADNRTGLYIPEGFAHGFQTLSDDTEILYLISEFYAPDSATGYRFDDPKISIEWPLQVTEISDKDRTWPLI